MKIELKDISLDKFKKYQSIATEYKDKNDIDTYIQLVHILTDKSIEEVEEMELDEFKDIVQSIDISEENTTNLPFITKIEIDGKTYISTIKESFNYNVKQISLLTTIVKNNPTNYVTDLAAIVFKPVDDNGNILNDYTEAGINERKKLFNHNVTMNVIVPYLNLLVKHFNQI